MQQPLEVFMNNQEFTKTLKEMVTDNKKVRFSRFKNDELWYKAENGFEFPVHVSEIGDAEFLAEDKALLFMRWIKKQLHALGYCDD
jgi:hypothetical protein